MGWREALQKHQPYIVEQLAPSVCLVLDKVAAAGVLPVVRAKEIKDSKCSDAYKVKTLLEYLLKQKASDYRNFISALNSAGLKKVAQQIDEHAEVSEPKLNEAVPAPAEQFDESPIELKRVHDAPAKELRVDVGGRYVSGPSTGGPMEETAPYYVSERTHMTPAKDGLSYNIYAHCLKDMLFDSNMETPLTVGIYGNWGQGKTSLVELVEHSILEQNSKLESTETVTRVSLGQREGPCCRLLMPFWLSILFQLLLPILVFIPCVWLIVFLFHYGTPSDVLPSFAPNVTEAPPASSEEKNIWLVFVVLFAFLLIWIPCCFCTKNVSRWESFVKWIQVYYYFPDKPLNIASTVEIINVKFNAMEYAGSDDLWVGIITNLCDKLEERFGTYRSRLYRFIKDDFELQTKLQQRPDTSRSHNGVGGYNLTPDVPERPYLTLVPYYLCCLPKLMCHVVTVLFIAMIAVIIGLGFFTGYFHTVLKWLLSIGALTGLVTLFIAVVRFAFYLCQSLKSYIRKLYTGVNKVNLERAQGLMHCIKVEVQLLKDMIKFMTWVEQRQFRVLLYVDDLDRCDKDKLLKLLQALNVILSEPETPFISIVAVDPRVIERAIEARSTIKVEQTRVNGHEYLKKFIHLPLSLPEVGHGKIKHLLELYKPLPRGPFTGDEADTPMTVYPIEPYRKAFELLGSTPGYISGNPRTVKRLCNILNLVMRLRFVHFKTSRLSDVQKLTWWIVLAELWPYRVNLLVHLLRDECNALLEASDNDECGLFDLYKENIHLLQKPIAWKSLLTLDLEEGRFLKILKEQDFSKHDAFSFLPFTINLDMSLNETFALAVGQENIEADKTQL